MGNLKGMLDFLRNTQTQLATIQEKLGTIQTYFNDNFNNVNEIRRAELGFLQDSFFKDTGQFPDEIPARYKKKLKEEETAFEKNLRNLEQKRADLEKQLIAADNERLTYFKRLKDRNTELDRREENLKARVAALEGEIGSYNKTIDELDTGLGFITNLFRMRKIQKQKEVLLDKRSTLAMEIDSIRTQWEEVTKKYRGEEREIMEKWNRAQTELSIATEKIDNLKVNRADIIKRAAFVSALGELKGNEIFIAQSSAAAQPTSCPRCKSDNSANRFFCYYCGARFKQDRPDVLGSLGEVGELNSVHANLMKGITGSVSILALIKGISTGVAEFTKSVESVKSSEDRYPLPKLAINVPDFTRKMAEKITELNPKIDVKFFNLHPLEFSTSFAEYTDKVFTDANIEKFFTGMGDELNRTTKEQWK
ncbi:MAG: hypothetical protein A2176_09330 [Spirochaetes bacterium RBG_13_51_14]|nr:MAG: hypothetical protein A2176_09330 [Spirochaetes bacterium RBG_13_51_14]